MGKCIDSRGYEARSLTYCSELNWGLEVGPGANVCRCSEKCWFMTIREDEDGWRWTEGFELEGRSSW